MIYFITVVSDAAETSESSESSESSEIPKLPALSLAAAAVGGGDFNMVLFPAKSVPYHPYIPPILPPGAQMCPS